MAEYASRFYEEFCKLDAEKTGTISTDDAKKLMGTLGYNPPEEKLTAAIADVDKKNIGRVNFDQFITLMTPSWEGVTKAFRAIDKDGNGFITVDELRYVLQHINTTLDESRKLDEEDITNLINDANVDGDGVVNYLEFIMLMMTQ